MNAYKLVRQRKDGTLGSLFIKAKDRLPINEWIVATLNPTKGFTVRKGWHCTEKPYAPHLSMKGRVWVKVEIEDSVALKRPESQGGMWHLSDRMKILEVMT